MKAWQKKINTSNLRFPATTNLKRLIFAFGRSSKRRNLQKNGIFAGLGEIL